MIDPSPTGAAARLARAAAATRWQDAPAAVRAQAEALFADTIGVIAAGATHSTYVDYARSFVGVDGPCTLIGHGACGTVEAAAQMHGGATTVLQWQDGHRVSRGHPASHLTPVLLALAEAGDLPAQAVMSAFVAGYEVAARVGAALGGLHDLLHDAGTFGTIGAAAAVAHVSSKGDADVIAAAIEAAASICPMPWRAPIMAGASIHHLCIGEGTRVALTAARAVAAGLTPLGGAIESFFGPRAGAAFDPHRLTSGIGEDGRWARHEILESYIKWWPVCAHCSTVADAAAALVAEHGAFGDDAIDVEVAIYGYALEYDAVRPTTDLAARFSIAAVAATLLAQGMLAVDDFTAERLADPLFRARLARVRVVHEPAFDALYPASRPCRVTARLADGRTLTATRFAPYGDATNPLTPADREGKVARLLAGPYGEQGAAAISEALAGWHAGGPIAPLSAALRAVTLDMAHLKGGDGEHRTQP